MSWLFVNGTEARPVRTESRLSSRDAASAAARTRRTVEEDERELRRRAQLAEQRCDSNTPDVRIRAWEQAHGLRLPSDPRHPVLDVIAIATRLTLLQVQAEQCARQRERERSSVTRDALAPI